MRSKQKKSSFRLRRNGKVVKRASFLRFRSEQGADRKFNHEHSPCLRLFSFLTLSNFLFQTKKHFQPSKFWNRWHYSKITEFRLSRSGFNLFHFFIYISISIVFTGLKETCLLPTNLAVGREFYS